MRFPTILAFFLLLPTAAAQTLPHPPSLITSDDQFLLPTSGVRSGTGTSQDPYIIEGWSIDLTLANPHNNGIWLNNTRAHVVLRDLEIIGAGTSAAILLGNAQNVRVERIHTRFGNHALFLHNSRHINVTQAWAEYTNERPYYAQDSSQVALERLHARSVAGAPLYILGGDEVRVGQLDWGTENVTADQRFLLAANGVQTLTLDDVRLKTDPRLVVLLQSIDLRLRNTTLTGGCFNINGGDDATLLIEHTTIQAPCPLSFHANPVRIANATFHDFQGLQVLGDNATIVDSRFQDSTRNALYLPGSHAYVARNRFVNVTGTALTIAGEGALVENNQFQNVTYDAIDLRAPRAHLRGNTYQGIGGNDIDLSAGAEDALIEDVGARVQEPIPGFELLLLATAAALTLLRRRPVAGNR